MLAIVLALCMLAPAATATWNAFGNKEPSSPTFDTPDVMWADPNTDPAVSRVYFNAFETHQVASNFNPNLATTGTTVRPFPTLEFNAMFGVWRDCNDDGYVGLAESAVLEYRAELLTEKSICPIESGASVHNDGQWVYEYLIFAVEDPCVYATDDERKEGSGHACEGFRGQPLEYPGIIPIRTTPQNPAKVWGDSERPDRMDGTGGGTCALSPVPEGTTSSTGMLVRYLDCRGSTLARMNTVLAVVDPNDETGLRWENLENPQKDDHPLNFGLPVNLYGNPVEGQDGQTGLVEENSGDPAYTYDCSGSRTDVHDPTGGELRRTGVRDETGVLPKEVPNPDEDPEQDGDETMRLTTDDGYYLAFNGTGDDGVILGVGTTVPSLKNPTGSYYDAANGTYDGVYAPARGFDGDCDPETRNDLFVDNGKNTLDNPSSEGTAQAPGRQQTDWTFQFWDILAFQMFKGTTGFGTADAVIESTLGARTPSDLGAPQGRFWTGTTWISTPNLIVGTPDQPIRTDLTSPEPEYYSFYATLDLDELVRDGRNFVLPNHGMKTYGQLQCPDATAGAPVQNGFDCDPNNWWKGANGADIAERFTDGTEITARVGDVYYLRDVDCFDNHVAAGVHAGAFVKCV